MTEINQKLSDQSSLLYRNKLANKVLRKARARTLIQAGGLLNIVGFFTLCGIEEGEDLQLDLEHSDKVATLLGILSEAFARIPLDPSSAHFEKWKNIGIRIMKMRKAKTWI